MRGDDRRVRPGRPADVSTIERLQSHLRAPSPELLEYGVAAGDVLVSTDGADRPIGYLLPVDGPARVHVAELVVEPTRRREGRGRELLATLLARTDGPVTLQVAPDNTAARSLYEGLGFRQVDRRPGAYPDGDALVYRLARD